MDLTAPSFHTLRVVQNPTSDWNYFTDKRQLEEVFEEVLNDALGRILEEELKESDFQEGKERVPGWVTNGM